MRIGQPHAALLAPLLFVAIALVGAPAAAGAEEPQPLANEPEAGTKIVHPIDGAIMVWVPSGYFTMGADEADARQIAGHVNIPVEDLAAYEWYPRRRVWVQGFFIDQHEVTNERWKRFVQATGYQQDDPRPELQNKAPAEPEPGAFDLYPAVNILWREAQRYVNWAGKTLPYEAQWEKAARGTDGRLYPWGNDPPTDERGVFTTLQRTERGFESTRMQPVGSKPAGASPYGALDMAGNVYEWTAEWMEPYPNNPERHKMFSYNPGKTFGLLRGGSFYHGPGSYSAAKRFGFEPDETYYHVGFRTVWEPPAGYFESREFEEHQAAVPAREAELDALRRRTPASPESW